jgi:uncharacterized membrane protein YagU involved in acid resistance
MQPRRSGVADQVKTALLGAAAGIVGVVVLDRVDWFLFNREDAATRERTRQVRPEGKPPADVLVERVADATGAKPDESSKQTFGQITHYAIGVAPAVAFALLRDKLPGQGVPRGLLFGLGLFLTQDEVLNTVTGLGAKPQDYPWQDHVRGLAAHLAYGVATEFALTAAEKRLGQRGASIPPAGQPAA